jgi:branched-chain amino acid transport system substrate-binding protein
LKSDDGNTTAAANPAPAAKCVTATIGVLGPTSGEADDLGPAAVNMANLAGTEYAAAHAGCKLNVRTFDSQGKADKALPLAKEIIADKSIIGVIGPLYSKETTAVAPVLSKGGVPMISSSASGVTVGESSLKYFHRTVGTDANSGEAMAKYIKGGNPNAKVFVIDDGNDYAVHAADAARETLGSLVVGRAVIQQDQSTGFGQLAQQIISSGATVIAFGGFSGEAAGIRKAVDAAGGSKIGLVAGPGLLDSVYVTSTGSEGDDTIVVCACTPGAGLPQPFQDKLSSKSATKPGVYVGEAYDAASAFTAAFAAGKNTRDDVNNFLSTYSAQGVTGKVSFDASGNRKDEPLWYFVVGTDGFFGKSRIQ